MTHGGHSGGNDDGCRSVVAAVRLMRLALPLLDQAGCELAAARLQHAIDSVDEAQAADPDGSERGGPLA